MTAYLIVDSLLTEYSRAFRSRLNFVEEPKYLTVFQDVDKAAVAPDQTPAERLQRRFAILKTAITRGHEALGGEIKQSESGLTGDLAEKYRRLVDAHGAEAMAPCESGICGNCRVQVTPQNKVRLNAGNVIFCSACGRMLYKPPE